MTIKVQCDGKRVLSPNFLLTDFTDFSLKMSATRLYLCLYSGGVNTPASKRSSAASIFSSEMQGVLPQCFHIFYTTCIYLSNQYLLF